MTDAVGLHFKKALAVTGMEKKELLPFDVIVLWTIEYLNSPVSENREISYDFLKRAAILSWNAREQAPSLAIVLPADDDGSLHSPNERLYTRPLAELKYGVYGRAEAALGVQHPFRTYRQLLGNEGVVGYALAGGALMNLTMQSMRYWQKRFTHPSVLSGLHGHWADFSTSGTRLSDLTLGPYTEPAYIEKAHGRAGNHDQCHTVCALFFLEVRHLPGLLKFTRSPEHIEAMKSIQRVTNKDPDLRKVAGTFGHIYPVRDKSYRAMAESMERFRAAGDVSTHDVFHIRDFPDLFCVA